ncbi:putative sinapoylglucose--sinapoylglucose O-sinapoyltransferase [Rosa chinensis]|uniref:Putative sinapoylglucose--sinapoylglucose O-sinapoyltransferase n=1 Tax=Rosa chinensis TaxID=74649 RepID=A0A2P6S143_ROSCH|nr:putative sinapoylglucose--sinapoylglucose O-sinapoyltransferase [Rosa chinensis]
MRSNVIIYVRFWLWHAFILLLLTSNFALAQSIIKNLPAFQGDLPFKLETGYVGVGDSEEVQLLYYFVESERSPENDPLLIWLTGGPRCSSFYGLIYEVGSKHHILRCSCWYCLLLLHHFPRVNL